VLQVDSHLEYHVLRLAIADEQMMIESKWVTKAEYMMDVYRRNWEAFKQNRFVSMFAPRYLLTSSLAKLTLMELWFLRDILERGCVMGEEEFKTVKEGNALLLWRSPAECCNGRVKV
jgi:hypothetical protein